MGDIHKKVVGCGLSVACVVSAVTNLAGCAKSLPKPDNEKSPEESVVETKKESETKEEDERMLMANELDDQYSNRAVRALESVRAQLGEDKYLETVAQLGSAEKSKSQGEYVANLLDSVNDSDGEDGTAKVMRACGYQCLSSSVIDGVKRIYQANPDLDSLIESMNKSKIGGGHLLREGNTIHASYDNCVCSIDQKKKLPGCYCQCSCGWFEKLFSTVLEQQVEVTLTDSIMNGADECDFVITLSE